MDVTIREYRHGDAIELLQLFRETVLAVNSRDYSKAQVQAWASEEIALDQWANRFEGRIAFVAECQAGLVGFVDLTSTGHLDRLFVSAAHQRQGIGNSLLAKVIDVAQLRRLTRITVESSITAKPFFMANQFTDQGEQNVECRGQQFVNFRMQRRLQ